MELNSLPRPLLARVFESLRRVEDEELVPGSSSTRLSAVCRKWRELAYETTERLTLALEGEAAPSDLAAAVRLVERCAPRLHALDVTVRGPGGQSQELAAALAMLAVPARGAAPRLASLRLALRCGGDGAALQLGTAALGLTQLTSLELAFGPVEDEGLELGAADAAAAWQQWLQGLRSMRHLQRLALLDAVAPLAALPPEQQSSALGGLADALGALRSLTHLELQRVYEGTPQRLPAALSRLAGSLGTLSISLGEGFGLSHQDYAALEQLSWLRELHLDWRPNHMIHQLPRPLLTLTRMRCVPWGYCEQQLSPTFWRCSGLTALELGGVNLGALPPAIDLPRLQGLTLLLPILPPSGTLPASLAALSALTSLHLRLTQGPEAAAPRAGQRLAPLRGLPPWTSAAEMPGLSELQLSGCGLRVLPRLDELCIRTLLLWDNELTSLPGGDWWRHLRHLDVRDNRLSCPRHGLPLDALARATALTRLDLAGNCYSPSAAAEVEHAARKSLPLLRVLTLEPQRWQEPLGWKDAPRLLERAASATGEALFLPVKAVVYTGGLLGYAASEALREWRRR